MGFKMKPKDTRFRVVIRPEPMDSGFRASVRYKENLWTPSIDRTMQGFPGEEQLIRDLLSFIAKNLPRGFVDGPQ